MKLPQNIERAVNKLLGGMNFASDLITIITPADRAQQAEAALRSIAQTALEVDANLVPFGCSKCNHVEMLSEACENTHHRHGKYLFLLHKKT